MVLADTKVVKLSASLVLAFLLETPETHFLLMAGFWRSIGISICQIGALGIVDEFQQKAATFEALTIPILTIDLEFLARRREYKTF